MAIMSGRKIASVVVIALALPGTAHAGFFDQLFGGGSRSGSFFGYQSPGFGDEDRPIRHRSHHVHKIVEDKPVRQTPTDLMHDHTLRYGDAVMTKTGISIFTGDSGSIHDAADFTPLKKAPHIKANEKIALVEINATRMGRGLEPRSDEHLITGRSSAELSKGIMRKDRDGNFIRYVGP